MTQTKPDGVSQYLWDRATGASPYGFNPTLITRDPATRDALVAAGYEDFVKSAYEKHMDQAAGHYSGNGATGDVYEQVNNNVGWYQDNYDAYTGPSGGMFEEAANVGSGTGLDSGGYGPEINNSGGSLDTGGADDGLTFGGESSVDPDTGEPMNPQPPVEQPPVSQPPPRPDIDYQGEPTALQSAQPRQATPFLDSYMRARERSKQEGPASSMMQRYMED